eukprot:3010706-Pyramimonas_sp.AAC.1
MGSGRGAPGPGPGEETGRSCCGGVSSGAPPSGTAQAGAAVAGLVGEQATAWAGAIGVGPAG